MSDFDPRPVNSAPTPPNQLPALPPQMPPMMTNMMPPALWSDASETKGGFNILSFLHALRRRWLLGLGVGCLVATTLAALLYVLVPVKYEAQVQLRIRRNHEEVMQNKYKRPIHPQDFEIEKQTQAALMKSPFVISAALRDQGIAQMPLVRDKPWFGERDNEVAWLERELKTEFAEGSEYLRLSMRERYPDQLKKLLNAITKAYMKEVVTADRLNQRRRLETLQAKNRELRTSISDQYERIGQLAQTYSSPTQSDGVRNEMEMAYEELRALNREKQGIDSEFFQAYEAYQMQQQRMASVATNQAKPWEVEQVLMQYPEYAAMKNNLIQLEQAVSLSSPGGRSAGLGGAAAQYQSQISTLQQQMEEFKYRHRNDAIEQLKVLNNNDDRQMQAELQMMQSRVQLLDQRRREIYNRYQQLTEQLRQYGAFSKDLMVLQKSVESDEEMQAQVKQEIETLQLDMLSKPQIEVLGDQNAPAIIPDESNWLMRYLQIIAAWGLALIGTVLGIALWDMQSQRVNNSQEIVDSGEVRVIGSLPILSGRRAGGLLPASGSHRRSMEVQLTRSIDSIRTSLLFARKQNPYKVIMVTSALGQEGKTTVASQLAVSFARSGRKTLLIDGDVRNPQQHVVLGMQLSEGFCELLRSDVASHDVIKPSPAENLWFLPAGYRDGNTDQYLASPVVTKLFEQLRNEFDIVVVDTGPVLTCPDAMLLGQLADTAVISIRRDVSRLPKVHDACDRLRGVGVEVSGAVLNGAATDIRESEMRTIEAPRSKEPQLESAE